MVHERRRAQEGDLSRPRTRSASAVARETGRARKESDQEYEVYVEEEYMGTKFVAVTAYLGGSVEDSVLEQDRREADAYETEQNRIKAH